MPKPNRASGTYSARNRILESLGYASYERYLLGSLWCRIRRQVFKSKGRTCVLCDSKATQIHHTRYMEADLRGECLKYLHPICRACHESVEFDQSEKLPLHKAIEKFLCLLRAKNHPLTKEPVPKRRKHKEPASRETKKERRKTERERLIAALPKEHHVSKIPLVLITPATAVFVRNPLSGRLVIRRLHRSGRTTTR